MSQACDLSRRFHVFGRGIDKFGTAFPAGLVQRLASCIVQLSAPDPDDKKKIKRMASGVLIHPVVVLCAHHSIANLTDTDISITACFECDDRSAPAGPAKPPPSAQAVPAGTSWTQCTLNAAEPQGGVIKTLEHDDSTAYDYALLQVSWKDAHNFFGFLVFDPPREIEMPKPARNFTSELLLIGHPVDSELRGEPTQATAGTLTTQFGPNPETKDGSDYGYASFAGLDGFSGGGVFNDQGGLVGILKGRLSVEDKKTGAKGPAFLNLGRAADAKGNTLLRTWMSGHQLTTVGSQYVLKTKTK